MSADIEPLDRGSPKHAAEVMKALCNSKNEQKAVLSQLLKSIAAAERISPHSWSVTLFDEGFRLNVGQVEAFTFMSGEVRVFLLGSAPVEASKAGEVVPTAFRSMPQPQWAFFGTPKQFQKIEATLQLGHIAYIQAAAVTPKGKPQRARYAKTHSPGLHLYAKHIVEGSGLPTEV